MVTDDNFYMQLALDAAWSYQGLTFPNPAVGCVIVDSQGKLLSIGAHHKAGSAHAELHAVMDALKSLNPTLTFPKNASEQHAYACQNHGDLLKNATVYVTLEPCNHQGSTPPCALLLQSLNVKRVVIGMMDPNPKAAGGKEGLEEAGIEVICGIMEEACRDLLEPFMMWQKGTFSFFKIAMHQNGVIDGGIVTGRDSRMLVHRLRSKTNLLVIGGNTVRVDRPTLDARMCQGKAPDVLIYSRQKDFDQTIPLFSIANRKVMIDDSFKILDDYSFVMIEGGSGMSASLPKETTWYLLFHSPNFKEGISLNITKNLRLLWQGRCGDDSYGWYKER